MPNLVLVYSLIALTGVLLGLATGLARSAS